MSVFYIPHDKYPGHCYALNIRWAVFFSGCCIFCRLDATEQEPYVSVLKQIKIVLISSAGFPFHSLVLYTCAEENRDTSLFTYMLCQEDASLFSWHSRASRKEVASDRSPTIILPGPSTSTRKF